MHRLDPDGDVYMHRKGNTRPVEPIRLHNCASASAATWSADLLGTHGPSRTAVSGLPV